MQPSQDHQSLYVAGTAPDEIEELELNAARVHRELGYGSDADAIEARLERAREFGFDIYYLEPKPKAEPGTCFFDLGGFADLFREAKALQKRVRRAKAARRAARPKSPATLGTARIRERTTCSPTRAGPDDEEPEPEPELCARGCGRPRKAKPTRGPWSKFCADPDCKRQHESKRRVEERDREANVEAIRAALEETAEQRRYEGRTAPINWALEMVTDGDGQFLGPYGTRIVPAEPEELRARTIVGWERAADLAKQSHPPRPVNHSRQRGEKRISGAPLPPPWKVNPVRFCDEQPRPRTAHRHLREKEEAERQDNALASGETAPIIDFPVMITGTALEMVA